MLRYIIVPEKQVWNWLSLEYEYGRKRTSEPGKILR